MNNGLEFSDKTAFHTWLEAHASSHVGVWLIFGKSGGPVTITANEALEEALCFGWIDGQLQSIDESRYRKYFARRNEKSKWSEKNKKLAQKLIDQGRMMPQGTDAIRKAKEKGTWASSQKQQMPEGQVEAFAELLRPYEIAHENFLNMPPSVQRTYTAFYLDAKMPKTQQTRLAKIVERLNQNLKPM